MVRKEKHIMTDRKYSVQKKADTEKQQKEAKKLCTSKLNFLKLKEQQSIQYTRTFRIMIMIT